MAFDINGVDDLMKDLSYLETERIAPMMLSEGGEILEKEVRARDKIHWKTVDMYSSIKSTGAMRNNNGYYLCIRPTGKGRSKVWNMEKMVYLEYGTQKEQARPVLSAAVRSAQPKVIEKMQEVFDREAVR